MSEFEWPEGPEAVVSKNEEGRIFPFDTFPALGDLLKRQRRTTKLPSKRGADQELSWGLEQGLQRSGASRTACP